VPHQWDLQAAFRGEPGPFVYVTRFDRPSWRRVEVACGGAFFISDWSVNGRYVGRVSGASGEIRFDITDLLRDRDNELRVEVACPPQPLDRKELATGVFSHWDCLPPAMNPGGIWRPVRLEAGGELRVDALWLETRRLAPDEAEVTVHARVDARLGGTADVRVRLAPPPGAGATPVNARLALTLPPGRSALALPLRVPAPMPWEPWSRTGAAEAARYDLAVRVATDGATARRAVRVGLRTVRVDRHRRLVVNGRPIRVRGWNYGPSRAYLAHSTAALCADDMSAARERGLDALRVHAHLDHPGLYAAADRLGMLLFQDGPLQWRYAPAAFPDAAVEIGRIVRRLAAHPSVVWLTAHNEPVGVVGPADRRLLPRLRALAQTFVWSGNRDVWDRALVAAATPAPTDPHVGPTQALAAGTMHVQSHSGVLARRPGEDSHLYMGWYPEFGRLGNLDTALRLIPFVARWVTEFGAQSMPVRETAARFVPERPTDLDWERLASSHMAQPGLLERNVGVRGLDLGAVIQRTQAYQAALHAAFIDRLRSRPDPAVAGFFGFLWADAAEGVTWSILDHERRPKAAFAALRDQLASVCAVALVPLTRPRGAARVAVPLVAVNDSGWTCRVRVRAAAPDATLEREAIVPPGARAALGALLVAAADLARPGQLAVEAAIEAVAGSGPRPGERVVRRYALPSPLWSHAPGDERAARPAAEQLAEVPPAVSG